MIKPWTARAFNQVPDAANQIHGDTLAKEYGFEGALVPGVTISAYLVHPAVEAWGMQWLQRGAAKIRVISPLYDEEPFEVVINEASSTSYAARLERAAGIVSATAEVGLPESPEPPPVRRGDPIAADDHRGPTASVDRWSELQRVGCQAFRFPWPGESKMTTYLRDESQMPELLQSTSGGFANLCFILGCSNWILERNAAMNPWVHLETQSQNYRPIPAGTSIIAEMAVADFFAKKGHEFVDVEVNLFGEQENLCLTTIKLRAIYKLRDAS